MREQSVLGLEISPQAEVPKRKSCQGFAKPSANYVKRKDEFMGNEVKSP
jgi:hypothetical protein